VGDRFEALHGLPRDEREHAYRELLASDEYLRLKQRMDAWCALWFWPAEDDALPLPQDWGSLSDEAKATVERLADAQRFFHWELEFPDVFRPGQSGFDVVLGNPPWETMQPESLEFFSRHDPLYRTYGKTEALAKQAELFSSVVGVQEEWLGYQGTFKALTNVVKAAGDPFAVSLARGKAGKRLAGGWELVRRNRSALAHREHPYRLQGSGKVYTYKLFLEVAHHLLRDGGRLGMLVPSGLYTDKGATELRKEFLQRCSWEWCYGFENRAKIFPITSLYKFNPIAIQRGGATAAVKAAFMRHDVTEWERPDQHVLELDVTDIKRFAPATWSFIEFRHDSDLALVERIYGRHALLGDLVAGLDGSYSQEFNMTSDAKHFVSRSTLEKQGLLEPDGDTRDPRVRARLRGAGFLPLYEGKSFWLHDPYFRGRRYADSVSKFMRLTTARNKVESKIWDAPRLCMRNVGRSVQQRTFVVGIMPPAVHGNSAPTLDGLPWDVVLPLKGILASLVVDYLVRMKVSANLNWFYLETIPIPDWAGTAFEKDGLELICRLNAVGADFPTRCDQVLIAPPERLAARLMLDALVADLFALQPEEFRHIAAQFPVYDFEVPTEYRYPVLAVEVFKAMHGDGPDAAQTRAAELAAARSAAGVGFGFDEIWQPVGGWERANREARELLAAAA
jgi:hypothetical protein